MKKTDPPPTPTPHPRLRWVSAPTSPGLRCSFQGEAAWVGAVEGREPSWGLSLLGAGMPSTSARGESPEQPLPPGWKQPRGPGTTARAPSRATAPRSSTAQAAAGSDRAEEGQGHSGPKRLPGSEGSRSRAETRAGPALALAPSIAPTSPAECGPLSFHPPGLKEGQRTYKKNPTKKKYQLDPQKNTV